jgi:hypothetical protein
MMPGVQLRFASFGIAVTDNDVDFVLDPRLAVRVSACVAADAAAFAVNWPVIDPDAIVIDAGMVRSAELVESETVALPDAAAASETVHVDDVPAGIVAGEQTIEDNWGGGTASVIDALFTDDPSVAVIVAV